MPKRIYFDYAASTPVDPAVFDAMKPYVSEKFGNPGSVHSFGQEAIAAVDASRETIARALGLSPLSSGKGFRQAIFTGSATEANNLALRGTVARWRESHTTTRPKIIVSAIEHESVLETARDMEHGGAEVAYLPVGREGFVDLEKLRSLLDERTVLVSVMYANNEVGAVQPIAEIAHIIRNSKNTAAINTWPLFHTDAAQAFQFLNCDVEKLGVDFMTISAHKIYGPKGTGTLYARDIKSLATAVTGGGQEFGVRSGTENVPAIVGFAKAVELATAARAQESARIMGLRDHFRRELKKMIPDAEINGPAHSEVETARSPKNLPNILSVYFPGRAAQDLLTAFDLKGLAASSGSACRSRALEASHVLEAMGFSRERARSSIRFSFGRPTTGEEVAAAIGIIKASL